MISKMNASALRSVYANNMSENLKTNKNVGTENAKESKTLSRVDALKEAIDSGEYKVDVNALAEKMADELL